MQQFRADLHIHSRFSRATGKQLAPPLLAAWARLKGLQVLGSGDCTHPVWRAELAELLRYDEQSGLYQLKDESGLAALTPHLPQLPGDPVRFMIQGEVSSIYKRGGKVRKVHNLIFMPTLEAAEAFSLRLSQTGNLKSDGRPILGLDSRDLLEMVLEAHPDAFLIPAHIWTPWFSVFGSKSGFDDIEECYGDLTSHIFALETGLSSDPAMVRLLSSLDRFRLVSNSDAHSAENLGREANLFEGEISYKGILDALREPEKATATKFLGTMEFYPEEGKYHMDGHRDCKVLFAPEETRAHNGICPVCGKPLTVGVLSRVMELADRKQPEYPDQTSFVSLVPLPEVLGEILGVGPKSRKVSDMYAKVLERFGSELGVLRDLPVDDLSRFLPPLGEAVDRMRTGRVILQGGYDGEYGVVRMFDEAERRELQRGAGVSAARGGTVAGLSLLPGAPEPKKRGRAVKKGESGGASTESPHSKPAHSAYAPAEPVEPNDEEFLFSEFDTDGLDAALVEAPAEPDPESAAPAEIAGTAAKSAVERLNPMQEEAVAAGPGPVLVLAGPGSGKTRTLIARIRRLVEDGVPSKRILAVTFTRRAAAELDERLKADRNEERPTGPLPRTDTLHALALELWHRTHDTPVLLSEEAALRIFVEANAEESAQFIKEAWKHINLARETLIAPDPEFAEAARRFSRQKSVWNLADYTDLLEFWLEQIRQGLFSLPWDQVLVDEVQDLSPLQLTLVRSLVPAGGAGFFGIGDPDQSIYGFRGAHGDSLGFFKEAWPELRVISLQVNYRSASGVVEIARALLGGHAKTGAMAVAGGAAAAVHLFEAPTEEVEQRKLAERVAALIGLGGHTLMDAGVAPPVPGVTPASFSPGDIAVLVRTHALGKPIREVLARFGVPVSEPETEAFWQDPRVDLILRSAGRMLGISETSDPKTPILPDCPEKILAKGPHGIAAYFSEIPPFDRLFWQSKAFRAFIKAFDEHRGWPGLLTWISLQNDLELVRGKAEKVRIITMHAAKGLEFEAVFVPCLEDGLMPFAGAAMLSGKIDRQDQFDVDEERRLLYVAVTRAKTALFLSHAASRTLYGKELRLKPSRFLAGLPEGLFARSTIVAKHSRKEKQLSLLGR